jgi:hypothetical protein
MVATEVPPRTGRRRRLPLPTLPQLWAFVAVALPIVAALRANIVTNDLAYQIRAGDLMLSSHHLPRVDTFTFTAVGRPWVDQQWGSQVLFALVYRAAGWWGLALLRAALVGSMAWCTFLACRAAGASNRVAAWLSLGGFVLWVEGAALRPQILGMTLFAATVWLVFERHRHPAWLWFLPPLTALWANLHGSFFLAPLLLGLAWLQDAVDRAPVVRRTLTVALASAAAATVNPFGLRVWSYAFDISTNPVITRVISEWQPPTIRDTGGALFLGSIALVGAFLLLRGRPTPWPTLVVLGVFALIGLEAVRGMFWWGFLVPPVVAGLLPPMPDREEVPSPVNGVIVIALVAIAVASLPTWRAGTRSAPSSALLGNAPVALTEELRGILRPGERFFDPVPWASWFELELPRNPVFLDPRIEVFPGSVLQQHEAVSSGRQGWQRVLDRWRIRVVVADRGEEGQLIPIIGRDPGWRRVYADDAGIVFVRAGEA